MGATLAEGYDLVILDLDGVVYVGHEAVPRAAESIRAVVGSGVPVAYVTNNASRGVDDVAALLTSLGVPAHPDEVMTSARASAELLAADLTAGSAVLVVGSPALRDEIRRVGLTPVAGAGDGPVAVVQGYGPAVGWADLAEGCVAIRAGARWVATNVDSTLPSARGPLPGNGSLVAALSTALGGRAPDTIVGKPRPELFVAAARHRDAGHVLVVGDRLDTDIEGAVGARMDSLLVLTGVSGPADLLRAGSHERPTYVSTDLSGLSTPDDRVRVPPPADDVRAGGWRVTHDGARLVLAGEGDAADALRALAAVAWHGRHWTDVRPDGGAAEAALLELALVPEVRGASAA